MDKKKEQIEETQEKEIKSEMEEQEKKSAQEKVAETSVCEEQQTNEEPKLPDPYINRSVGIKNGMYGKWAYDKKAGEFIFDYMGAAVYLEKIFIYAETMNRELELFFYDPKGEKIIFRLPREKMTEQYVSEFTRKGIPVQKKNMSTLLLSIFNQEKEAPLEIRHEKLGFGEYSGHKVFFGSKSIKADSTYAGRLSIFPTGEYSVWKKMIEEEVLGTDLEIILAIAAAAPLIDFLKESVHTGNLLVSLVGESSTGKTTAGCLAVSLGARCSFGDSTILTFADSKNSLMNGICSAYPTVIDEGSLIRYNPTSLLYELAEGREKGRLTKELTRAEANTFNTAILMTTEKSILGMCDQNTGLLVRCLEFEEIVWTKSAQSADRIKAVCEQNYGFVIENIATLLLKYEAAGKTSEIVDAYWSYQKRFVEQMRAEGKYTPLTERICKNIAMIALGAEFFSKITKIQLDAIAIGRKVLSYTAVTDAERLDIGRRAWEYLGQYIVGNYANFVLGAPIKPDDPSLPEFEQVNVPRDCKGRITTFPARRIKSGEFVVAEVFVSELVLEDIFFKGGFQDKKVILKKWRDSGILHSEPDRYKADIEIVRGQPVKGYQIFLPASLNEARKAESAERKKKAVLQSINESEKVQTELKTGEGSVKNEPGIMDKAKSVQEQKIPSPLEDEKGDWKYEEKFVVD